jgi:hypothetical protein
VDRRTTCSIRDAHPDDGVQVTALLTELGYPGNRTADVRRRLQLWQAETASRTLVAELDGPARVVDLPGGGAPGS